MQEYKTTDIAAENWGISKRRVQVLCSEGRVAGAIKHGGVWAIPINANKPEALKSGKKGE